MKKYRRKEGTAIYIFYADVYLLQNLWMDYIALTGANYFLRRGKGTGRILLTAMASSVGSLSVAVTVKDENLRVLLTHFILNTVMVIVGFGKCRGRDFWENWAVTYFAVIVLGGVAGMLKQALPGLPAGITYAVCAMMLTLLFRYLNQRRNFGTHLYPVLLKNREKNVECRGYWDSGNQLKDPYIMQPVSIIRAETAGRLTEPGVDLVRYVPYQSLGKKDGLLAVVGLESMIIYDGKRKIKVSPAQVGIADPGIFEQKEYDLILHASLLTEPGRKKAEGRKEEK